MPLEGILRIGIKLRGGRIRDVVITSTRPVQASRIFHGRDIAAVSTLMPRLFSICGTAQACAASHALSAARGRTIPPADLLAHRLLLLMETAQEHAWRLCIDGARLAGEPPRMPAAAAARALLGRLQRALFPQGGLQGAGIAAPEVTQVIDDLDALLAREFFGVAPDAWCARLTEAPPWWSRETGLGAGLLRSLENDALLDLGNVAPAFLAAPDVDTCDTILADPAADSFIAAPSVDGNPRETTALGRQWQEPALALTREIHGAGLATRFTALMLELARVPQQMRALLAGSREPFPIEASSSGPGTGIARVPAARGLLVHRVELDGDTVARYQILAPTEWNFHPQGVVARSLHGYPVRDAAAAKKASELIVHAIDPCVGFEVTFHA